MLLIYRLLINFILLISPVILIYRILKRKEDYKRCIEKIGIITKKRNKGKLVWFHGSSVGEILSIIPLIEILEKKKYIKQILLTSNTLSSANVFNKLKLKKTIHQFCPIDSNFVTKRFLNYWKPSSVFFIESEIWPNLIINVKKKNIPLGLINARVTRKSFKKWSKISFFSKLIFNKFDFCLTQNSETNNYLKKLGALNIKKIGNLKFSETSLKNNERLKKNVKNFFNSKKILFAGVSTHPGEEIFCANVHLSLKKQFPNRVTIIIPRHIHRSVDIKGEIENLGLKVHLHSENKIKLDKKIDIYLVDTFGETKSFLKICKVVFLGGSLIKHGGQNPLEAARFGCRVMHGPNVSNFSEVYSLLNKNNISLKVNTFNNAKKIIKQNLSSNFSSKNIINKLNAIGNKVLILNKKEIIKYIK